MFTFKDRLKKLVFNRNRDDLHSAMCYFKSGRIAYIYANYNKSLTVILRDEGVTIDFKDVAEVLEYFKDEELTRFET